ncbi:MAG: prepilin-type N-terminal cleavage/methylation domain-containing protein [Rickettsiales bacterium]|jgi:prepilin-type N-terminal cleavage/methylation domain-containing protein|nr:prepilin-type N-terminal cleavage/methylation domain-containing protein [Rickettsiales bacterium]
MKNCWQYFKRGFSLVEFSMVLAAMGLLILALTRTAILINRVATERVITEIAILDAALAQYRRRVGESIVSDRGMLPMKDILEKSALRGALNQDGAVASKYRAGSYWILANMKSMAKESDNSAIAESGKSTSSPVLILTGRDRSGRYGLGSITAAGFANISSKFKGLKFVNVSERLSMARTATILHRDPTMTRGMEKISGNDKETMKNLRKTGEKCNLVVEVLDP